MFATVFVRGRRWAIVRRNSSVCRFFCSGYASGPSAGHAPTSSSRVAASSTVWPLAGDAFTSPSTASAAPVLSAPTTSYVSSSAFATTCIPFIDEPSLRSMNEKAFWPRTERTQPLRTTVSPIAASPMSFTLRRGGAGASTDATAVRRAQRAAAIRGARAAANMGKKRRTRDGAKAMDDDAFASEDAKPTKGPMPRIKPRITKLSRKQKLRKALKQERGERSADRAVVSTSRKTSKADRKANAKALW